MTTTQPHIHQIHDVRLAQPADAADVARIIDAAFFDDPTMLWITPDEDRRAVIGPPMFRIYADVFLPLGETYVTTDLTGAALWALPGQEPVAPEDLDAFLARVEAVAGEDAVRLFELEAVFEANKPEVPHAHLQLFGTLPERQGEGIGSTLLRTMLPRLDREGIPAYLEATTLRSKALYERHGFVNTGLMAPAGGPTLWAMWRDPA